MSRLRFDRTAAMRLLSWAWDKASHGLPGQESAADLAGRHMDPTIPLEHRLDALARRHVRHSAVAGFAAGVGGLAALPVALPANMASVLFVQLRMVQAMAIVCGHDVADPRVRALCALCLCGGKGLELAKSCGIRLGAHLTRQALERLTAETVERINRMVGFRLLARLGEGGTLGASRLVPLVGGVVGAACDMTSTRLVAKAARRLLISEQPCSSAVGFKDGLTPSPSREP